MPDATSDEKRSHPRVAFQTRVTLTYADQQMVIDADSRDISLKGLFIKTDTAPPLDTACGVELDLSGATSRLVLSMRGRVVRHTSDGVGIAFDAVELDSYQHLKHILMLNAADPADMESRFPEPSTEPDGPFG